MHHQIPLFGIFTFLFTSPFALRNLPFPFVDPSRANPSNGSLFECRFRSTLLPTVRVISSNWKAPQAVSIPRISLGLVPYASPWLCNLSSSCRKVALSFAKGTHRLSITAHETEDEQLIVKRELRIKDVLIIRHSANLRLDKRRFYSFS